MRGQLFNALWEEARHKKSPSLEEISAQNNVQDIFLVAAAGQWLYFTEEFGRDIRTDFSKFPKIDVTQYDRMYGSGTARSAIKKCAERLFTTQEPCERE